MICGISVPKKNILWTSVHGFTCDLPILNHGVYNEKQFCICDYWSCFLAGIAVLTGSQCFVRVILI